MSVDIFGLVPGEDPGPPLEERPAAGAEPQIASTFAVGEEGGSLGAAASVLREAAPVVAPLGKVDASLRRGESARVEVVVRTRKIGHFFPGGTVDAFDVWVELEAVDSNGKTIFHSGEVTDGRQGPGRAGRALLPQPAARRARQPDQQAQRLGRALARLRAPDPAGRRRHDPLPAAAFPRTAATRSRCARRSTTASSRGGTRSGPSPACATPSTRTSGSPRATTTGAGSSRATPRRSRARSRRSPTCRSR